MNNRVLFVVLAMVSITVKAERVKCGVGFVLSPTIEDVAAAYDKSDCQNLLQVSDDLRKAFGVLEKKFTLEKNAVVELQALPGFRTLRTSAVSADGNYSVDITDEDPDCRLFCACKIGDRPLYGVASVDYTVTGKRFCQYMQLRSDYNSVVGRCLHTDGVPFSNAVVTVRHIRTPTEQDEHWLDRIRYARTDANGYWRVDGIETPSVERLISRISNTNIVVRYDSRMPPYGIQVGAIVWSDKGIEAAGGVTIPNVTARDRAAAERIFAAYKRKTGKDWPRPAPMTDFPVSTNNVIYAPDIVLKK